MISLLIFALFTLASQSDALLVTHDFSPRQAPSSNTSASGIFFNVGQNYEAEWQGFANAIKIPAGISVYGDIYSGALNPDSQNLLATYAQSGRYVFEVDPSMDIILTILCSGYVEIGFSWKDAMTSNGYTQYQVIARSISCHSSSPPILPH